MAANFCNGKLSLFQRLVVHYQLNIPRNTREVKTKNTQKKNVYCHVMKQNVFKGYVGQGRI